MQQETETELWIRKLGAALAAGKRLAPVSGLERALITHLMVEAGRIDLATETYRLIPVLFGDAKPQSLREHAEAFRTSTRET